MNKDREIIRKLLDACSLLIKELNGEPTTGLQSVHDSMREAERHLMEGK